MNVEKLDGWNGFGGAYALLTQLMPGLSLAGLLGFGAEGHAGPALGLGQTQVGGADAGEFSNFLI